MSQTEAKLICPRCFHDVPDTADLKFCPHCGLSDVRRIAADTAPIEISSGSRSYRVLDRLAIGSYCNIYRCHFKSDLREVEGVFKIARDSRTNGYVANEAQILNHLHANDADGRFAPFLPKLENSFEYSGSASSPPRLANVLGMHADITSLDELYTLEEVKAAYPAGIEVRDAAWIWRRILTILGFTHSQGVAHCAVVPMHILVEPNDHKVLLIDWCCAARLSASSWQAPAAGGEYGEWYRRQLGPDPRPSPALDIGLAARSMIELLGGDPVNAECPAAVDVALQRHFQRCVNLPPTMIDAWRLLDDFDKLIEALWGPRQFHVFKLPAKRKS